MRTPRKILGSLFWIGLTVLPHVAWACPNCYSAITDTKIAAGVRLAILMLIGVTGLVCTGVMWFFTNIQKRTERYGPSNSVITPEGNITHDPYSNP